MVPQLRAIMCTSEQRRLGIDIDGASAETGLKQSKVISRERSVEHYSGSEMVVESVSF
jgi:hypothetical protein